MSSKSRVIALFVGATLIAALAGAVVSYASSSQGRGHGSPLAVKAGPPPAVDTTGWANAEQARASLAAQNPASLAEFGLTPAAIASTRAVYTFPAGTPSFAGVSVYQVSRPGRGSCLYLLDSGSCTARAAALGAGSDALPVQVSVTDFDGPTGPVPVALVGDVAPEVIGVSLACAGTSYEATLSGRLVTWIAPSAAIGANDCTLRATLAGGREWSERL